MVGSQSPERAASGRDREAGGCAWCGASFAGGFERLNGRRRCLQCGAQTTWPQPSREQLAIAYGTWYRPARGRFSGFGDRLLRRLRGRLAGRLAEIAPPGPILDVGAGDGALLDALSARGRDVVGLELESTREDVLALDLRGLSEPCAAIVFWHSLEHLPDAGEALEHAASLLAPGGVIVVALPNPDSLQARLFGDRWLALDLPRHLVHVPASALRRRLTELGLRIDRISYLRGGQVVFGWLHGIVGRMPATGDLYDAVRRPEARQVALGPGRRALTLAAAAAALPAALLASAVEVVLKRGGTVYAEARRV